MYETKIRNFAELRGVLAGTPVLSHESRGERFYTFPLETRRLSGAPDRLNIVARESLLKTAELTEAPRIHVIGELRSFNNKHGEGAKLVVSVFAREIYLDDGDDLNVVELVGTLCKPPNLRTTPMGRDICDLMLAVGRRCGRSDYLPCICWGIRAHEGGLWQVGDRVSLHGRVQSRQYIKLVEGSPVEKTAFEVSAIDIEKL
jgi:hypothetical protein